MKRLLFALAVFLAAGVLWAEVKFESVSATTTSFTAYFTSPRSSVLICNFGSDKVYYRVFEWGDTPAAATSSYATLVAGTVTAPICKSFGKTSSVRYYRAVSIIADSGTATVEVESQ